MNLKFKRRYSLYSIFTLLTIMCGLLSRSHFVPLPVFISTYAGDTLWALMVFWLICILAPSWKTWKIGTFTILFSFAIEISQLYHAPWIDHIRNIPIGGLVLGYGFKFSDLVCYSVGILFGTFIDQIIVRSTARWFTRYNN